MSQSTKQKSFTYPDAIRSINADDVRTDIEDACEHLALSTMNMMETFSSIAKQLHTIDVQGLSPGPPLKPQWDPLSRDFGDLLWQFRNNAGFICGRLKIFCDVVLPLVARNSSSSRSHQEKLQVLQSYMSISADHANLTRALASHAMKFNNSLNAFHTDFLKSVSQRANSGQRELRDLSQKLSDLESHIRQLCLANGKFSGQDVTHFIFTSLRTGTSCTRKPTRSRISHQRLPLNDPDLAMIGRLCEQLDRTRNEVAHAQYASQVCRRKTDALAITQTTMSKLVSDEMIMLESGLSLFLSIWSRLQCDCIDILQWLQNPRARPEMPPALVSVIDSGDTLYATVAGALDVFVTGIDPSHFTNKT
ncbi:hypothetical protein BDZ94DRAFT_1259539 [Collybia nuda]|uniref:Uncharacterized protein n=1 Tax=Collybia nuda TaxID=64659 RepID=A0A9P5Y6U0_9AGAR|nr:hypothetical protein BDZ94DRAFT_1259539 [Collybia nuda]